ncbi:MAG: hypothetical protein ABI743_01790, partial [bacterium]
VKRGTVLAEIINPLDGRREAVRAPHDGLCFSRRTAAKVEAGESLVSLIAVRPDARHGVWPVDGEVRDHRGGGHRLRRATLLDELRRSLAPLPQLLAAE